MNNNKFHTNYFQLERKMEKRAIADGDVFLPNAVPESRVNHIFICMEPSLGRWADTANEAKSKVEDGFRNFHYSIEDFILHFCIRQYLCSPNEKYHITDISKGAMLVEKANEERQERYDRWYKLLQRELNLIASHNATIFAVGNKVSEFLQRQNFDRPFKKILHYSPQAANARNTGIKGHECDFQNFKNTVSLKDLIEITKEVLEESKIPTKFKNETLTRIENSQLTLSRKKLIFNYKIAFKPFP